MTRPFDPEFDVIYSDEVAQLGDDPRRLRRLFAAGHLIRVRRGAYVLTERWLAADERMRHLARVHAASHHARERFVVAGTSAAAVWDAPVFAPYGDVVEVLDGYRGGGRSEPGVRRLTSAAEHDHAVTLGRLEVTDVARTAIDLAAGRPLPEALAAIDWAISHRTPVATTLAVIRDRLREMGPRRGVRVVWRAAELAVADSGSGGESFARGVVHELGFEAPVCQLEVVDAVGRMFADFAWPGCRVIVEFDGWLKYSGSALQPRRPAREGAPGAREGCPPPGSRVDGRARRLGRGARRPSSGAPLGGCGGASQVPPRGRPRGLGEDRAGIHRAGVRRTVIRRTVIRRTGGGNTLPAGGVSPAPGPRLQPCHE